MKKDMVIDYVSKLGLFSQLLKVKTIHQLNQMDIEAIDENKFDKWFQHYQPLMSQKQNPGAYFVKAVTKELANGTFKKVKQAEDTSLVIDDEMKEMIRIARTPWLDVEDD